jgi:hypothetical protein
MPITLNTGAGTDSTFVQSTAAGSTVAIHGQNGNDGVSVSNAGTLQGLLGPVSVDNTSASTSLVIDDSNDTSARTISMTSAAETDTISGVAPSSVTANSAHLSNFTLDGGSGGNTITLAGLTATGSGTATLNTGIGADTTNVGPSSPIGVLNINGQAGADSVNLGSAGSVQQLTKGANITNSVPTKLTLNDSADSTARAVTVGATQTSGLAPAAINYANVSALTIDGGGPSDTFAVSPSATTADEIVGGGPASIALPGNTLNMNLTGVNSPALSGTPGATGAQGTWTFANRSPVSFSHMQSLNPTALLVGDTAATVGASGSSPLLFGVSLLAATAEPVSAKYATADGSATAASGAYLPASGAVAFPPGTTSETALVYALGAPTVRPPQTLTLSLSEPINALLARSTATGTITDSFSPAPLPGSTAASAPGASAPSASAPLAVAPVLSNLAQTRTSWRAGKATAVSPGATKRPPVGTSFSFSLNESATVALAFNQSVLGRKSGGRCVAQTNKNRKRRACRRAVTRGTLRRAGHAGANHISFQGRVSPTVTLKPGPYTLLVGASNAAGQRSRSSSLTFTIVK